MLAEEFIQGREFTVAVLGNGSDTVVFPPMEIIYKYSSGKYNIYSYNAKKNYKQYIEYACPALLEKSLEIKMLKTARKVYDVLGCRDFSRIDFRLSEDGKSILSK